MNQSPASSVLANLAVVNFLPIFEAVQKEATPLQKSWQVR